MNPVNVILLCLVSFVWPTKVWAENQCIEGKKMELLKLKGTLIYSSTYSTKLTNWNHSTDCCKWPGIYCAVDGDVVGLDLRNEHISSSSDDFKALIALTSLQGLDLSYNSFISGKIPSSIYKMTPLRYLNLESTNLTGSVNESLSNLRFLESLHLQNNFFFIPVPRFFANFTSLKRLFLQNSSWFGNFPDKIFHMPSLQIINLSQNKGILGSLPEFHTNSSILQMDVSGTRFGGIIPKTIGNMRLVYLNLAECQFSGNVPRDVFNMSGLYELRLEGNNLTGVVELDWISNLPNLSSLYLSDNFLAVRRNTFSLDQLRYLALNRCNMTEFPVFGNQSIIRSISLHDNHIEGKIPTQLPPTLWKLDMSKNRFNSSIPGDMLGKLPSLLLLNAAHNNITGTIPPSLCNAVHLKSLTLADNHLSGSIPDCLFRNLSNLDLFNVNFNQLSGSIPDTFIEECIIKTFIGSNNKLGGRIPKSLENCKRLQWLALESNQISDTFPCQIKQLSELTILTLSSNLLYGDISCVGEWPALEQIELSFNNFTSFTEFYNASTMGQLKSLLTLNLVSNSIKGSIPSALCSLSAIQQIGMPWNQLHGTIPDCLVKNLTSLRILNLRFNDISGSLPEELPGSCKIESLTLEYNKLKGLIPRSLANCKSLQVLELGHNYMKDWFPCDLKNLSNLTILSLRQNLFHGEVGCIATTEKWRSLRIFDISMNNFSGVLPPDSFVSWDAFATDANRDYEGIQYSIVHNNVKNFEEYYIDGLGVNWKGSYQVLVPTLGVTSGIDFSDNQFEGRIPESIGRLSTIHFINLSHNAFSGPLPSSLGSLRQLESLDLSNNQLTGNIPPQLANLRFLQWFSVSMNKLEGRIPTSIQLQSFSASSFQGNKGLYGPPLTSQVDVPLPSSPAQNRKSETYAEWYFKSAVLGFVLGLGLGLLWASLLCLKTWRLKYNSFIDYIVSKFVGDKIKI